MENRPAGPDPARVGTAADLTRELDLLRARAARGTGRRRIGLDELVRRVGLPRSTVHSYVGGTTLPALDVLDRIVIALGATPAEQAAWSEAWYRVVDRRTPASTPALWQAPPDVDRFVGRAADLRQLTALVAESARIALVSTVSGIGGVGKTALVARWCHLAAARDRFPAGCLYVDLRGFDPAPALEPTEALAGLLRSLGVAGGDIPPTEPERAARFRTLVDGRRLLLVLDNARDADQVRPLLPGSPPAFTIVTSRHDLAGLVARDGARRIALDVLPPTDAVALLRTLIGARVDADPDAAATLAERCDRLPLALRIAAERVAARPDLPLPDLVADFDRRSLDLLATAGDARSTLRAVFSWSYEQLPAPVAATFRLLGQHPGPSFDAYAVAALTGTDLDAATSTLDALARANLIEPAAGARWRMHDLLRAYATELLPADGPARARLVTYYTHAAAAAMRIVFPGRAYDPHRVPATPVPAPPFPDVAEARAWLETEQPALVALIETAEPAYAVDLAAVLWRHLYFGAHHTDALRTNTAALHAARTTADHEGESTLLYALALTHDRAGRLEEAIPYLEQAHALRTELGDAAGQLDAANSLGVIYGRLRNLPEAARHFTAALAAAEQLNSPAARARALTNLGSVYLRTGPMTMCIDYTERAVDAFEQAGDLPGKAAALNNLGGPYARTDRVEEALTSLAESLRIRETIGDRPGIANTTDSIGEVYSVAGRYTEAVPYLRRALKLARELSLKSVEAEVLTHLGTAIGGLGDVTEAQACLTTAAAAARRAGDAVVLGLALTLLGDAARRTGDLDEAENRYREALELTHTTADRWQSATARHGLGSVHATRGDAAAARTELQAALAIYRDFEDKGTSIVERELAALDDA